MKTLKCMLITLCIFISVGDSMAQSHVKKGKRIDILNRGNQATFASHKTLANDYTFSMTTGTYSNLTGAISVNNGELWDDAEYKLPIGFSFQLYDIIIDSLYFGLGYGGIVSSVIDSNYMAEYAIIPFEADLIDRGEIVGTSQSPISYTVEGAFGTRILKLEWNNAGFFEEGDVSGTLNDFINFQLWLYEGSNTIEFHYGPHMITDPDINYFGDPGAIIGLTGFNLLNAYLLSGPASNPVVVDTLDVITGTPANGTIYRFQYNTNIGVDADHTLSSQVSVYPNPANGIFHLHYKGGIECPYQITDIAGKVIQQGMVKDEVTALNISHQQKGIYFLTVGAETIKLLMY
jgi:hypothetical protein